MPRGFSWRKHKDASRVSNRYLLELLSVCRNLSSLSRSELRKTIAYETAAKEAVQVALMSAQGELEDLERTAVAVCQELEGEGGSSGSSVASRLRSLGGRVAERLRSTFCLGVQRTLAVASMHYDMNLKQVAMGYVVAPGIEGDDVVAAME